MSLFAYAPKGVLGGVFGQTWVGGKPGIGEAQAELVEGSCEAPLLYPAPAHLAHGKLALLYQECASHKVRTALRWLPTVPYVYDPRAMTLRENDGALVCEPPFDATPRFSVCNLSRPVVQLPGGDGRGLTTVDPGVEVEGARVSYCSLHAYCTRGDVDKSLSISDAASSQPSVFLRISRLRSSQDRCDVRKALEGLAVAQVKGLMTVQACWVSSSKDRAQLLTKTLHTQVTRAVSKRRATSRKLPPLFSSQPPGVRAAHEALLRRHVLLYTARSVSERARVLESVLPKDLEALWNCHAARHSECLRRAGVTASPLATKRRKVSGTFGTFGAFGASAASAEYLWCQLTSRQKRAAPGAMATCLEFAPPADFPSDLKWTQIIDRFGWRGCPSSALDVAQTRDCRKRAEWEEARAVRGGMGSRILVTNTAATSLEALDGVFFYGDGGFVAATLHLISWRDVQRGEWCMVDCVPVPPDTHVVELAPEDLPCLSLMVQFFPLLRQPAAGLPAAVHPHTQTCAQEHARKCRDWSEDYHDALLADSKRSRGEKTLDEGERRTFLHHEKAYEQKAREYDAVRTFPAWGSDLDPGDHTGEWLTPRS